jgi:O-methyltransferase
MAPRRFFFSNLRVIDSLRHLQGCVIECGVWRGGMCAAIAEIMGPDRQYFLFDSFEGLPPPTEKDGEEAERWQKDVTSPTYYNNCCASIEFAEQAMKISGVPNYKLIKGWFQNTVPQFVPPQPIAILRLDGDWYDSTIVVLDAFYKYLAPGGIVIVDDYYSWDGCSKAVHDFLSMNQLTARIRQDYGICVIEPR